MIPNVVSKIPIDGQLKTNGRLVRHKNSCRFAVEAYCLSPGTPFSYNETTTYNRLENRYSLKDLDYRVTLGSPSLVCHQEGCQHEDVYRLLILERGHCQEQVSVTSD
jgi:hypothetical protein